ncbi:MAG TPA: methionine aminotransferase [Bacteroidia bacterium]|jgi:methionine aminotransferase|nr:methionine aminotransferase [Bacteroidia bacterium]
MPVYPEVITSKLPTVGTTIFTIMSRLANEYQAINLSQGFPDFSCDEKLQDLVYQSMRKGQNQYAPMAGILPLREKIAEKTEALYGATYDPETEITITAGGTQAIYTAITAMIREDDEVLVFEPAYDCYVPAIELNGGKAVFYQLHAPAYSIDWAEVQKLINHHTRMIILNTPHNPTGSILTAEDMQKLEKLIKGTDIVILSDEVYEHILFDGHEHQSVARYPGLADHSFIISSFGKTFHTTGWKMGYCLAPRNLMEEFRKVHQFLVFSVNTPTQYALAEYLKQESHYLELGVFYQQKRDYFNKLVAGSRFTCLPSAGTYFQLLGYKNISEEKDTEFAIRMVKEYGLASIPVSVFYHQPADFKVLRFCFAKQESTLEKAAGIICRI